MSTQIIPRLNDNSSSQDAAMQKTKLKVSMLESMVADAEIEHSQARAKASMAQKIINDQLASINCEIAMIKSEIEYMQMENDKRQGKEDNLKKSKENMESDESGEEYIEPNQPLFSEADKSEAKLLYRELSHRFHPDKHQEFKAKFTQIFQAISNAKANLATLKDIQLNPQNYFDGYIPEIAEISNEQMIKYLHELQKQYSELQIRIQDNLNGHFFKLYAKYYEDRTAFDNEVSSVRAILQRRLSELKAQLNDLLQANED